MPQFTRRRLQPLRADSYRRLARLARSYADRIEAASDLLEAEQASAVDRGRQRKRITDAINGLYAIARSHWHRHHGHNPVVEDRREFERQLRAWRKLEAKE